MTGLPYTTIAFSCPDCGDAYEVDEKNTLLVYFSVEPHLSWYRTVCPNHHTTQKFVLELYEDITKLFKAGARIENLTDAAPFAVRERWKKQFSSWPVNAPRKLREHELTSCRTEAERSFSRFRSWDGDYLHNLTPRARNQLGLSQSVKGFYNL